MTNNTASISGLGEIVLGGVIWFAAQKLVYSDISAKAKQLHVYPIIRYFVVFIVTVMRWQSESYISEGQSAYETKISLPSETNISV